MRAVRRSIDRLSHRLVSNRMNRSLRDVPVDSSSKRVLSSGFVMFFSIRFARDFGADVERAQCLRCKRLAEPILSVERATMRPFILISAALVFASPAIAHNWQEYSYPDYSFTVTFPADPQIETTTYQVTDDRKAEAHISLQRTTPAWTRRSSRRRGRR